MHILLLLLTSFPFFYSFADSVPDYSQDIDSMVQLADTNNPSSPLPLRQSPTIYSAHDTFRQVNGAISIEGSKITTRFQGVKNGICSSATAMAFIAEISKLQTANKIRLAPQTLQALKLVGKDGVGFWGRWNADGPGTAVLFQEYGLGRNFQEMRNAKPGDFMKVFWNDRMGEVPGNPKDPNNEHGHSVIFEGTEKINGEMYVKYWSANSSSTPGFPDATGFKLKYRKLSDIKHAIFSRLEHPENLDRLTRTETPKTNSFLSGLTQKSYSYSDGVVASGLFFSDPVSAAPAATNGASQ
jgi:hypothetical protein